MIYKNKNSSKYNNLKYISMALIICLFKSLINQAWFQEDVRIIAKSSTMFITNGIE